MAAGLTKGGRKKRIAFLPHIGLVRLSKKHCKNYFSVNEKSNHKGLNCTVTGQLKTCEVTPVHHYGT